jgi:hypothetical protein
MVSRGPAEGGPHEPALATWPSRRFVSAGGLTLLHDGLLEHELVEDGAALALTLLRCTGILSHPTVPARPNRAGPALEVPDAQMRGEHTLRYAVAVGDVDPWELAEIAWTPLLVAQARGGGGLARAGSRLEVRGGRVSALQRRMGQLEIRMFNPADLPADVEIPGHSGFLVDLADSRLGRWAEGFTIPPWGVITAQIEAPALD